MSPDPCVALATAPPTVMCGSDAYHMPELFYLAAKWDKRFLGTAMATLVEEGVLTSDAAVSYSRMILRDNAPPTA